MAGLKGRWGLLIALIALGVYFALPILASIYFTIVPAGGGLSEASPSAYGAILTTEGFGPSLLMSFGLGVVSVVAVLALLLPAMVAVELSLPKLRPVVETLCTLPLIIPPIALGAGVIAVMRSSADGIADTPVFDLLVALQNPSFPLVLALMYVILALPFVYRSLDAGLSALPVRTLVEAASGLGASWRTVMLQVVLPNLRTSVLNAAFLSLALVLGEFTIAVLLGFQPFAVWIYAISGSEAQVSVAASVLSLLITWFALLALSYLGGKRGQQAVVKGV